jgi:hypothetical protein
MMFIYVIAVYVSSDPGTYIVHIRLPSKTGCDRTCSMGDRPGKQCNHEGGMGCP